MLAIVMRCIPCVYTLFCAYSLGIGGVLELCARYHLVQRASHSFSSRPLVCNLLCCEHSLVVWVHESSALKAFIQHKECDLSKTIPLVIHGDDAESHRRRSFTVTTFGGVVVTQCSLWDSKILLYVLDSSRVADTTQSTLDMWVCWSLVECQLGFFLDRDPWGQEYAPHNGSRCGRVCGEWIAVLTVHKGDEKYLQKTYKSSHSAVSKNVCMSCRATSEAGDLLYTLHGPKAAHRQTLLTVTDFIRDVCGVSTWVRVPGWSPQMITHDWLHVVDLTLIPEASASALIELARENIFGAGTMDEKLRKAHIMFIRACRQHNVRT